jgi:2-polyprenyl-6-methoxyphenol hydroxylase-like FAD-dependent oxidoreductase
MGDTESAGQVLVVGAGPAGLFAAVELRRLGVHARVIERDPAPPRQARATALQPGSTPMGPRNTPKRAGWWAPGSAQRHPAGHDRRAGRADVSGDGPGS